MIKNTISNIMICSLLLLATGSSAAQEIITFKGIPLDKPGVKDDLRKICLEYEKNSKNDCNFNNLKEGNSKVVISSYGTGNFNTIFLFDEKLLKKDGSLINITMFGTRAEILAQVLPLSAKYGKPKITTEELRNKFGATFKNEIFTWTDARGSKITINSIYNRVDSGSIDIDSPSYIMVKKIAEKSVINFAKENL